MCTYVIRDELVPDRRPHSMKTSRWLLTTLSVIALGACTNEKIVYQTREPFNPPPDATNGFLGYYTVDSKQTTCGNCHVGVQPNWVDTKHTSARPPATRRGPATPATPCPSWETTSGTRRDTRSPPTRSITMCSARAATGQGSRMSRARRRRMCRSPRSRSTRHKRTAAAAAIRGFMSRSWTSGSSPPTAGTPPR